VVFGEQVSHLLIQLAEVLLDQAQCLERELQEPTVEGMQGSTGAEDVT
jgi:hypothetical protein